MVITADQELPEKYFRLTLPWRLTYYSIFANLLKFIYYCFVKEIELIALNLMRFKGKRDEFNSIYHALLNGEPSGIHINGDILKEAEKENERVKNIGARIITFNSAEYPERLRNIPDPPVALYVKGDSLRLFRNSVSIVGSRKCSPYGRNVAYKFAKEFASFGIAVVSGLAVGIDSASHLGAIDGNGKTAAVLGTGIDIVYPASNSKLYSRIETSGALVSEFPLGTRPTKYNFPFRNRIISGLSLATIVIEAARKSGSLITARLASEQGKDVFSVPGNITSRTSEGTNDLLKDGAIPITCTDDVISYIPEFRNLALTGDKETEKPNENEEKILSVIENSAETIDTISQKTGISVERLTTILTYMELKCFVKRNGGRYIKIS